MFKGSTRPLSALYNNTDYHNTDFHKAVFFKTHYQQQTIDESKPIRLSRKKNPKHSHKSSQNVTLHHDKQQLYCQTINIKQKYHEIYGQNIKLKTKVLTLEKQLAKKNTIIKNRNSQPLINRQTNIQLKQVQVNSVLITNLKSLLQQQKVKYQKLNEECERLKRTIKYTKIIQLQLQLKAFQEQIIRLKGILDGVDFTKLNQKQSFKKLSKLQKKFKVKQKQNIALLEINMKFQNQLRQNEKQIKTKEESSKNREMKLMTDLTEVKKRLAISMKRKEILEAKIKQKNHKYQNHQRWSKNINHNNLFENTPTFKQVNTSQSIFKRPLTASNKVDRIQFHQDQIFQTFNTSNKQSSQYQNIYEIDQFDQQEPDQPNQYPQNTKQSNNKQLNNKSGNNNHKNNTIIQQQESFNEFDQLCYLITYRFLAQGWNYNMFAQQVKQLYIKKIDIAKIKSLIENEPFYLEQSQSEFLIKYLFEIDQIENNQSVDVNDFLNLMKSVIYQYHPFPISKIKQIRMKFVELYTLNIEKWIKFFQGNNGFIHHNDFHQMLTKLRFQEEEIQQIIAELSLFVYDLTQFSMQALQKYVNTLEEKNGKIKESPSESISNN